MKKQSALFAIVALAPVARAESNVSAALMNGPRHYAWSAPSWGFIKADATAKNPSLAFDQAFDSPTVKTSALTIPLATGRPAKKLSTEQIIDSVVPPVPKPAIVESVPQGLASLVQPRTMAAQVLVIDEESLEMNEPRPLAGAEVHWVSQNSGLSKFTHEDGYATSPYVNTVSAKFVVTLPGYLPAVGYATGGVTAPVILMRESRVGTIVKSLGVVPDPERVLLLGKTLQPNLKPADLVTVDASVQSPFRVFYSIGSLGLFHPAAKETGAQGDFLVSGLARGLEYLMPSDKTHEWPAWIVDTTDLSSFVTTTLADNAPVTVQTQIVDAMTLEKPTAGIHVTIGGQRGLYLPDDEGFLKLDDLRPRGSADLLEVRADGYQKTWVNAIASRKLFPSAVSLFRADDLRKVFRDARAADISRGLVFGNLRPERFTRPVKVSVYGPNGKKNRNALVLYFDENNRISKTLKQTEPVLQNFAVANLDAGEWHVLLTDPESGRGMGIQVVRVEDGTISQIQF